MKRILAWFAATVLAASCMVVATQSATSIAAPCDRNATPATLSSQISAATAGQTICLATGNYGTFNGTNKAVTLQSATGQGAVMGVNLGSGDSAFTLASVTINTGNVTNGANGITVRDSNFTGPIKFTVQNSNIVLDHNTHLNINGNSACCRVAVYMVNGQQAPSGLTIRNSVMAGGDSDGIQVHVGMTIVNNEFRDICQGSSGNHTDNIQILGGDKGAIGVVIQRNLVHQTGNCSTQSVAAYDEVRRAVITDNVFENNQRQWALELFSDDGSIVDHNTVLGNPGCNYFGQACGYMSFTSKTQDDPGFGTRVTNNIANQVSISRATLAERHHNMLRLGTAPTGDFKGIPQFMGGANPATYQGFCLAAGSPGKGAASDGLDVGIRCVTAPPTTTTTVPTTTTTPPTTTTTTTPPPAAPLCITASAGAPLRSVALDWDDTLWAAGSTNRRYEVHEDLFNGMDNFVTTVTVSSRTSGTLAPGNYRYFVIAKDSTGVALVSLKVTVTVPVSGIVRSPAGCTP